MGEPEVRNVAKSAELRRQAKQLAERAEKFIAEAEAIERQARHKERRKGHLRLIQGGAVATAIAVGWRAISRPQVAAASLAGAAGLVAVPVTLTPAPSAPANPPQTVIEWERAHSTREQSGEDEIRIPVQTAEPEPEPNPAPAPDVQTPRPTAEPEPAPVAESEPRPSPTLEATATVPPTLEPTEPVDIEVTADNEQVCLDSGLIGLELAVCLEAVR